MRTRDCTIPKARTKKEAFQAPTTPGWQILLEAAQAVARVGTTTEEYATLVGNLIIRKVEHIPADKMGEITTAIAAAADKVFPVDWSDVFVEFLHSHLGKVGVSQLIKGSNYVMVDCDCGEPGYHISHHNPDVEMMARAVIGDLIRSGFVGIFPINNH